MPNKTVESILANKIINIKVKNINVNIIDDVNYVIEDSCLCRSNLSRESQDHIVIRIR